MSVVGVVGGKGSSQEASVEKLSEDLELLGLHRRCMNRSVHPDQRGLLASGTTQRSVRDTDSEQAEGLELVALVISEVGGGE